MIERDPPYIQLLKSKLSTFPTGIPSFIHERRWIKIKNNAISCIEIYFCKYFVNGIVAHIIFDRVNFFSFVCNSRFSFFLQGIFFSLSKDKFQLHFFKGRQGDRFTFFFQIIIERTVAKKLHIFCFSFQSLFFSQIFQNSIFFFFIV